MDLNEILGEVFGQLLPAVPVEGGWMNAKWRVSAPDGDWLLKLYDRRRFPRQVQLDAIQAALGRQMALTAAGLPVPALRPIDGRPLGYLTDGTPYAVMRFVEGIHLDATTVTPAALRSLGRVRAQMQAVFDTLPLDGAKGYPPRAEDAAAGYPMALAHEDFSPDNMLFIPTGEVAAILDFDRSCYHFRDHDIGRATLSFCLVETDGGLALDPHRAAALFDGYGLCDPAAIADTLRATYRTEADWWLNPAAEANPKPKIRRFVRELHWLRGHLGELDTICEKIKF